MKRRFKSPKPEVPEDPSVRGNYNIIYKRANGTPEFGNAHQVRAGDVVEYYDEGMRTAEVASVKGRGDKMRVRTKPLKFQGMLLRAGETIMVKDLRTVLRLRPDLAVRVDPDTLHREFVPKTSEPPPPPPPPLPEVKFAPVAPPPKPSKIVEPITPPKPTPKIVRPVKRREEAKAAPPVAVPKFAPAVKPAVRVKATPPPVVKAAPPSVKLQIREKTDGYHVVGRVGDKKIRIPTVGRETAEKILAVYKNGGDDREVKNILRDENARRAKNANPGRRVVGPVKRRTSVPAPVPVKKGRKVEQPVIPARVKKVVPPPPSKPVRRRAGAIRPVPLQI